jgi:hypothetical protein
MSSFSDGNCLVDLNLAAKKIRFAAGKGQEQAKK